MSSEENRSSSNLIVMCLPHADEVDKPELVDRYPTDLLLAWKTAQVSASDGATDSGFNISSTEAKQAISGSIAVVTQGGSVIVGGQGGQAIAAGGGGGGALGPGALGGRGGDGGVVGHLELAGAPGGAPGSGGGGGGSIAPHAIPAAGPKDGTLGSGYSDGYDGGDGGASYVGSADEPLVFAPGGRGGSEGVSERGRSDRLRVSTLLCADYVDVRDGLSSVVRGGYGELQLLNVPAEISLALLVIFEAGGAPEGEYTATVELLDPVLGVAGTVRFPVTVVTPGDVIRIPRLVMLDARLPVFGAYKIRVSSELAVLATLEIIARRSGEAEDRV
jgi:hypothetical protein